MLSGYGAIGGLSADIFPVLVKFVLFVLRTSEIQANDSNFSSGVPVVSNVHFVSVLSVQNSVVVHGSLALGLVLFHTFEHLEPTVAELDSVQLLDGSIGGYFAGKRGITVTFSGN